MPVTCRCDTADETAKLAGERAIIRRAVALTRWVGPEGKAPTMVGVLRKPAVPGACAAIGNGYPFSRTMPAGESRAKRAIPLGRARLKLSDCAPSVPYRLRTTRRTAGPSLAP